MNRKSLEKILRATLRKPGGPSKVISKGDFEDVEIEELTNRGLIEVEDDIVKVSSAQRLKLVEEVLKLNGDPEALSRSLNWREFEDLTVMALAESDYIPYRGLVFKDGSRKYQIDVIGIKGNRILCMDCKHWRPGGSSTRMRRAAMKQSERTERLAHSLGLNAERLGLKLDRRYRLFPGLIVLADVLQRFIEGTPVISILRLRDFLDNQPPIVEPKFKYYRAEV